MNEEHANLNINWKTSDKAQKGEWKVQPRVITSLWDTARENAIVTFYSYVEYLKTGQVTPKMALEEDLDHSRMAIEIDNFFSKDSNRENIELFKTLVQSCRTALNNPEMSTLLEDYKLAEAAGHEKERLRNNGQDLINLEIERDVILTNIKLKVMDDVLKQNANTREDVEDILERIILF